MDQVKIKDCSKEKIVREYQNQVRDSIDKIESLDGKKNSLMKDYIKNLEENIIRAPVELGWLFPEDLKPKKKLK